MALFHTKRLIIAPFDPSTKTIKKELYLMKKPEAGDIRLTAEYVGPLKLDFGHFPRNQIAGKWQPGEGFMAGAWEAESFRDVYLATRPHLISGRYLLTLA